MIIDTGDAKSFKQTDSKYLFIVDNTKDIKLDNIMNKTNTSFEIATDKENVAKIIKELTKKDIKIYEVKKQVLTLEEAFLKKTGGNDIV